MSAANDLGPEPAGLLGAVAQRIFGARGRAERAPNDADLGRFAGEVVGVTGAGGSVGARLVAALLAASPATRVVAFDQDDTALQRVARAVDSPRLLPWLGNVRDPRAVGSAFAAHRPQLVVHCAAVKHSDLLERHPREALQTNVVGTLHVARAAARVGARLVNVSTDKAASARGVLGASKRLAERVVRAVALEHAVPAVSVRLGNVLDSRGSVVEEFLRRARRGEPLAITDPTMTRLWTTSREVVALVAHAGALELRGECLVMPLGTPVAVGEVARFVTEATGSSAGSRVVGARLGDAQAEALCGPHETPAPCCRCGNQRIAVAPWCDEVAFAAWLAHSDGALAAALRDAACRTLPAADGVEA